MLDFTPRSCETSDFEKIVSSGRILVVYLNDWNKACDRLIGNLKRNSDLFERNQIDVISLEEKSGAALKALRENGIFSLPYTEAYEDGQLVGNHEGYSTHLIEKIKEWYKIS